MCPHALGKARPHAHHLQPPNARTVSPALDSGQTCNCLFLLVFAPFFTQFSPECHKSREEEGYTSWELQIPQKLIGKILPKPATFEPRDPDVKTEPTKHSELRKNLLELAVSLDCLKT
ncbi:hypothetical protein COP1_018942 [Malus domestica]